jgi:hypothetical protein
MGTRTIRRLTPADTDEVLQLAAADGVSSSRAASELAAENDYYWMGLVTPTGRLCAVHRSMRWGRHLLLKGVSVDESARGSEAALQLAFALRDAARNEGYAGVAAWVEPHKPEAGLARMLRLREIGPMVHLFEVPVSAQTSDETDTEGAGSLGSAANTGTITLQVTGPAGSPPMVPNLLGSIEAPPRHEDVAPADGEVTVHWVVDGRRLVLSACPCVTITQLPQMVSEIHSMVRASGADVVEVPLPAADLLAALFLTGTKARRLSRTPARLGRLDFAPGPPRQQSSACATATGTQREFERRDELRSGPS